LVAQGDRAGSKMQLLESVLHVNEAQPEKIFDLLAKHFPSLQGVRISLLGLAFRPDTNDMRESPAIPILRRLLRERAVVKAYDPIATQEASKIFPNGSIEFCETLAQAVDNVEAIVLVTRWEVFREIPEVLRGRLPQPVFIDGRRMLDKGSIARYEGIGL
jgi:UDPglucose 6-dehydrogenase